MSLHFEKLAVEVGIAALEEEDEEEAALLSTSAWGVIACAEELDLWCPLREITLGPAEW